MLMEISNDPEKLGLIGAFIISEIMAFTKFKSNGILHFVFIILKSIFQNLDSTPNNKQIDELEIKLKNMLEEEFKKRDLKDKSVISE